ncbi:MULTISPECIES: 5-deoxy-glucuronate isomerase [Actinomadura]|jgi:5-deoxy-glucuronate isomerase|uniref:5-deoxy-glucuronate isomerase n=1 Tax=Actinomadura citrea TaxID=46158 RepID=A0A7Y9GFA8_9ACTN|nr:5-deoxy-glucuronate isomerase [Actinomadura citrea]NYE15451.1 5-deoxy-glucuronate isomerase [Actinomadura citrea]GGT64919.1 5-deoxy-glucuronate isomerase [Actinomadura citrea]
MKYHLPAGTAAEAPYGLVVTPESAGWAYSGLRVLELPEGGSHEFDTGEFETIVLPLAGSCAVQCDGERFELEGRDDVFARVSDFAYVPRDARVTIRGRGRFALAGARCERRLAPRYGPAEKVPVELRGAGSASRQVNNFGTPEGFPFAEKLIACEVLTPAGCWSSFPPHKHDEQTPDEAVLEEIYYFEVARDGMAYQRVYGSPGRPIDVLAEVRSGDAVLIPHGWHGPSMAPPGHDLYYLNVMAGPSPERAWRICDDPAHAWIRDTWEGRPVDSRLPLTSPEGRS